MLVSVKIFISLQPVYSVMKHLVQEERHFFLNKLKRKFRPITWQDGPGLGGGAEVQLYSFYNLGARWEWVVDASLFPGKTTGTHCTEGWVALGPVRPAAENLTHIRIRNLNCPARRKSLYRLRYPGHGNGSYV